jgi:hypothetical protein
MSEMENSMEDDEREQSKRLTQVRIDDVLAWSR